MSSLPIVSVFNDGYIAEMYESFQRDPASVDESWRQYFSMAGALSGSPGAASGYDASLLRKAAGAAALISAIQRFGHLAVQLDPLGTPAPGAAELMPEFHGVTDADLERLPASAVSDRVSGTAADVVRHMRERYSGSIAFEVEHISDETEREWFRAQIEGGEATIPLTQQEQTALLTRLTEVDGLERFLHTAYQSVKRFSIEGVDALVPMLDEAIVRSAHAGAKHVAIGMAHRGRLNVLTHIMGKPYEELLSQFEGRHPSLPENEFGDVKYHMGRNTKRDVPDVGSVTIELVPNPSHLEVVNPVVAGVARARQRVLGAAPNTRDEASVLPIVVHGDASFPGEGVVTEAMNMSLLRGYRVGGALHIIANNQVGFTTDPIDARSTHYASDPAKGYEIPIVHVNGDDAEACVQAVRLGIAYRQRFNKDFLIDIVGYRRHGHNEADQPLFTQPTMYATIAAHKTPRLQYAAKLVAAKVMTDADVTALDQAQRAKLQTAYEAMKKQPAEHENPPAPAGASASVETAVRSEKLIALNEQMLSWPPGFTLHNTLQKTMLRRREAMNGNGIEWGHAEALAFASMLTEGVGVRITGQDAERGTFGHRNAVLHATNGDTHKPLANLPQATGAFEIYNSPLTETAVMGFEFGFSIAAPDELVLWEAQYGDFANVAQPIVDQFLSASRSKWRQESGLVLLLPHGYEGQGPEHSSARLERYLQLSAEESMSVAYPSTPAQYFHILRRQAARRPRRPLILMQPKSLLRLPAAASSLEQLANGTFMPVIDDPKASANREAVQRLVFCTGRIYYDLASAADRPANVALIRVEELSPWPREIVDLVDQYTNVEEVVWAQEEPKNMGAWTYVQPRLRASIGTLTTLRYIGRPERSSPAEGYTSNHQTEQNRIVKETLTYAPASKKRASAAR